MKEILFILSVLAVTVYLTVAAWEDHKTCEVTRWKHLIGGIPVVLLLCSKYSQHSWQEYALILVFSLLFVLAGCVGVYGMADGYVLMILVLLFASIGGVMGIGMVILIMVIAGFSFVLTHLIKCIVKRRRLFQNMAAAFIPHILVGYVLIWIGVMIHAA